MYTSYDKLRMLLIKKNITKNDLANAACISSRTMAKLSRNESVTTETLMKLCEVLDCDIGDIVSFTKEPMYSSLFDAFKKIAAKKGTEQDSYFDLWELDYEGRHYRIFVTKKAATKYSHIYCRDGMIQWVEYPKLPHFSDSAGELYTLFNDNPRKDAMTVVVISGKPGMIWGLDADIFRSSRKPGDESHIHVMSMAAFKLFSPAGKDAPSVE